jgi:hypothetical protein
MQSTKQFITVKIISRINVFRSMNSVLAVQWLLFWSRLGLRDENEMSRADMIVQCGFPLKDE